MTFYKVNYNSMKSILILSYCWLLAFANAFLHNILPVALLDKSFKITLSHIMIKTFIFWFILVNISYISYLISYLISYIFFFFFVCLFFSKWFKSTINKSRFRCTLGLNLPSVNKKLLIISFILYCLDS